VPLHLRRRFRRRFREFHGTARHRCWASSASMTAVPRSSVSSSPRRPFTRPITPTTAAFEPVLSCHGRVLMQATDPITTTYPFTRVIPEDLFVCGILMRASLIQMHPLFLHPLCKEVQ
jgi:hypothetical protein